MSPSNTYGRPRASSWAVLEEAAGELFLEKGYGNTSIADITARAGVSRNTFFNYFGAKSDLLWSAFDSTFAELPDALVRAGRSGSPEAAIRTALAQLAAVLPPENVALAYAQAEPMGLGQELAHAAAHRISAVSAAITRYLTGAGVEALRAQVLGTAYAGAMIAAIGQWSRAGAAATSLPEVLARAWSVLD